MAKFLKCSSVLLALSALSISTFGTEKITGTYIHISTGLGVTSSNFSRPLYDENNSTSTDVLTSPGPQTLTQVNPSLNLIFGYQHLFESNLIVGAEIGVGKRFIKTDNSNRSSDGSANFYGTSSFENMFTTSSYLTIGGKLNKTIILAKIGAELSNYKVKSDQWYEKSSVSYANSNFSKEKYMLAPSVGLEIDQSLSSNLFLTGTFMATYFSQRNFGPISSSGTFAVSVQDSNLKLSMFSTSLSVGLKYIF